MALQFYGVGSLACFLASFCWVSYSFSGPVELQASLHTELTCFDLPYLYIFLKILWPPARPPHYYKGKGSAIIILGGLQYYT